MSPPLAGAWIEMLVFPSVQSSYRSPPLAGAWIEMSKSPLPGSCCLVAPPRGGVD